MPNPSYPELALGNIINPGSQSYESVPGYKMQPLIGYFEVDPTDPKLQHPIRMPYTGLEQNAKPDERLLLSGSNVWYGQGIRIPKGVSLQGVTSLTLKTDMPASAFPTPFPHASRNLYNATIAQRVSAMNSLTEPAAPALKPFWKVSSVEDIQMVATPFQALGILTAPSDVDGTMTVESNVPLTVLGNREKILRVVVQFYLVGLASVTQPQDLWGYNNTVYQEV